MSKECPKIQAFSCCTESGFVCFSEQDALRHAFPRTGVRASARYVPPYLESRSSPAALIVSKPVSFSSIVIRLSAFRPNDYNTKKQIGWQYIPAYSDVPPFCLIIMNLRLSGFPNSRKITFLLQERLSAIRSQRFEHRRSQDSALTSFYFCLSIRYASACSA